ncbi:serine/threonine-protein kinase RsbW [Marinitoga hydrogenitolerans DSM 16785]|uniref:Serine/threonine-protein kinase RsbW n=1 Tax=Marinitoga hydrogenitolerans (strain DSM 16785 / JCM 12826 / AT1271) TaxID=1122195 RepID=A0A1M4Z7P2_MARH1|nr:ATP-binding protein [Marinitoga hydrogenitolerans]SHF13606.1 serine/threonine-protein kinase RsbW [Marinitoga hydrogenitolerans DSM 16785]
MESIKIEILSKTKYIKILREAMKYFLRLNEFDNEEQIFFMELALNEAVANVIEHTYKFDEQKKIIIKFEIEKKFFKVSIRDFGEKIDKERIKSRDLDDVKDHGLGVHIINQVFDEMMWKNINEEGNLLILKKSLEE